MKIGLCLSGGGAKGAYEIGVVSALYSLGVKFDIISGSSIGALNAAMLCSKVSIDNLKKIWLSLNTQKVLDIKHTVWGWDEKLLLFIPFFGLKRLYQKIKKENSVFSETKIKKLILDQIDFLSLCYSDIELTFVITNITKGRKEIVTICGGKIFVGATLTTFTQELIIKLLLATSAIPVIFPPQEIFGSYYVDGGVVSNSPLEPLYKAGCDEIYLVLLNRKKEQNVKVTTMFDVVSLTWATVQEYHLEIDSKEIRRHNNLLKENAVSNTKKYIKLNVIQPSKDLPLNMLEFDKRKIADCIELGYKDTMSKWQNLKLQ